MKIANTEKSKRASSLPKSASPIREEPGRRIKSVDAYIPPTAFNMRRVAMFSGCAWKGERHYLVTIRTEANTYFNSPDGKGNVRSHVKRAHPVVEDSDEIFRLIDLNGGALENGDRIAIRTRSGRYFNAYDSRGNVSAHALRAHPDPVYSDELFTIVDLNGGKVKNGDKINIRTRSGLYFNSPDGKGNVRAHAPHGGRDETFTLNIIKSVTPEATVNRLISRPCNMISRADALKYKRRLRELWGLSNAVPNDLFNRVGENAMYRYGFYIMALWHHGILEERDVKEYCRTLDLLDDEGGYHSGPSGGPHHRYMSTDDYTGTLLGLFFGAKVHVGAQPWVINMFDRFSAKDKHMKKSGGTWFPWTFKNMFDRANNIRPHHTDGLDLTYIALMGIAKEVKAMPLDELERRMPEDLKKVMSAKELKELLIEKTKNIDSELLFLMARALIARHAFPTEESDRIDRLAGKPVGIDGIVSRYYIENYPDGRGKTEDSILLGRLLQGIL